MTDTTNQRADLAAAERVFQGVLRRAGDIDDFEHGLMRDAWDACMAYHADPAKRQKDNDSAAGNGDGMVLTDEQILAIGRKHFRAGHDPKAEPAFVAAVRECLAAPAPQAPKCGTCNDNGMIGGPSYYAPDEGGVPCPDCATPAAAASEADKRDLYPQRLLHESDASLAERVDSWHERRIQRERQQVEVLA
ncbi:MAG: hypothetical protein CL858_13310 [Cupriavidus sp.]|nr:hypothetical protein [Cupriavidus sp.]